MSGADDQRGAEPDQCRYCPNDADRDEAGFLHCIECGWTDNPGKVVGLHETIDRLRAELAETRDRRDYLQGQLDIIYDAEYSRNDALKRRIERLGTAGDALAGELDRPTGTEPEVRALIDRWRSVRGDAPTPGGRRHQEVLRDGQARIRLGERGIEIVPDRPDAACVHPELDGPCSGCAPADARTDGQPTVCTTCWFQSCARCSGWAGNNGMHGVAPCPCEHGQPPVDDEIPADTLTAEQYRHIYDDLIHGLAVDLGLDPDKAGGGSITAAVRRLVAATRTDGDQ